MKTTSIALLCAIPLFAAFAGTPDLLDLTPSFEAGRSLDIRQSMSINMDLDEISMTLNGEEQLDGAVEFGLDMTSTRSFVETVVDTREGRIAKMTIALNEMTATMEGEATAMSESQVFDESPTFPTVGRTIEVTVDPDGAVSKKDVTVGVEVPLSEAEAQTIPHQNRLSNFLPQENVEVGVPFELMSDWSSFIADLSPGSGPAELKGEQAEALQMMQDAFVEATTVEAFGKVTSVTNGIATIEYELQMLTSFEDMMELIKRAIPEASEAPPVNAQLQVNVTMTGTGTFDLGIHQLTSIDLEGEFEVTFSGDADVMGPAEANASVSGELAFSHALAVQ